MYLLRCLALLKSVSFVAAQCSLVFPWLTSDECGVDPLDNSYPEYPVSYVGSCGPSYAGANHETIYAFAEYIGTDGVTTDAYAEPSNDNFAAYTYTVSDIANTAIQSGSVVTLVFTDANPQAASLSQVLTYTAVPKPSIFFTTATSTVQASAIATTTSTSTSTVLQTSTSTLPQATKTSQCTVLTSIVTAKTSTTTITHIITPKPVTVTSTQYSWRTTKPVCLPCKKAGQKRDLAPRAHNRRLDKRQSEATAPAAYTYEVPNCGSVTPTTLPTGTVVIATTTSTLTIPTIVFTSPTTTVTATPTPPTTTVCSTASTTLTTTPMTTITDSTVLNPSIVHTTTVVTYMQTVWTKGVRPCR